MDVSEKALIFCKSFFFFSFKEILVVELNLCLG